MTQCRNKEKEREGLLLWSGAEGLKPSESLGVLKNYIDKYWALRRIRFRCFRMETGNLYFWKSGQEVLMIHHILNYWLKPWELCLPKAISEARYTFFFCCEEIVQHIWVKQFQYKKLTPWKMLTDLDYLYVLNCLANCKYLQMFINNVSALYWYCPIQ